MLDIKLVDHPSRRKVLDAKGKQLWACPKCKDESGQPNTVVEPDDHKQWLAVKCDRCGGQCVRHTVPNCPDMHGISLGGVIVGICTKGPDAFISRTTGRGLDESIWQEIKRYVDKQLGGSAVLDSVPPPFPVDADDDEDDDDEMDN